MSGNRDRAVNEVRPGAPVPRAAPSAGPLAAPPASDALPDDGSNIAALADRQQRLTESASQTAGPYLHIGAAPSIAGVADENAVDPGRIMVDEKTRGERITIEGLVLDGAGEPAVDCVVEVWQADADGRFPDEEGADPHFHGWGRAAADFTTGTWRLETIRPGARNGAAPHLHVAIMARGIGTILHSRIYLSHADADPLLDSLGENDAATLIAQPGQGPGTFTHTIRLQPTPDGAPETVFLLV